ncbi:MAG: hypothetical protein V4731_01110 [Pseudomonadota bacterium]
MRHLFLALLIALLPLRGWLGDAMAIDMASVTAASMNAPSQHPAHQAVSPDTVAEMAHHDCGEAVVHSDNSPGEKQTAACDQCPSCDACHAVGLALGESRAESSALTRAGPASLFQRFASAESFPGNKPPIS